MKFKILISLIVISLSSCGSNESSSGQVQTSPDADKVAPKKEIAKDDSKGSKGIGEIKRVSLNDPLDEAMIETGKNIYELKCSACHKLSEKRVVGPGWKGVTKTRRPEWIMNMITNVEVMLDEDPEAQKLLEECLTRMPNQNVSVEDARSLLEFMYFNDAQE